MLTHQWVFGAVLNDYSPFHLSLKKCKVLLK